MTKLGIQITEMLIDGQNYGQISRHLSVASSTIAYYAKQLGRQKFTFQRRQYDWKEIQAYYDSGHTLNEVKRYFGMNPTSIQLAKSRGDFHTSPAKERKNILRKCRNVTGRKRCIPHEMIFIEQSTMSRSGLKKIILEHNLLPHSCSNPECQLFAIDKPSWGNQPLSLHLDHKNGVSDDHRLENLRWLCPNCHSQTTTYAGRNKNWRSRRASNSHCTC